MTNEEDRIDEEDEDLEQESSTEDKSSDDEIKALKAELARVRSQRNELKQVVQEELSQAKKSSKPQPDPKPKSEDNPALAEIKKVADELAEFRASKAIDDIATSKALSREQAKAVHDIAQKSGLAVDEAYEIARMRNAGDLFAAQETRGFQKNQHTTTRPTRSGPPPVNDDYRSKRAAEIDDIKKSSDRLTRDEKLSSFLGRALGDAILKGR